MACEATWTFEGVTGSVSLAYLACGLLFAGGGKLCNDEGARGLELGVGRRRL